MFQFITRAAPSLPQPQPPHEVAPDPQPPPAHDGGIVPHDVPPAEVPPVDAPPIMPPQVDDHV